jgi:NTP pyrophosphatase (non-canonical NTP hydrolase)
MQVNEYTRLAMRTNKDMGFEKNLIHAAMLMACEGAEVLSEIKRNFAYGKEIDRAALIKEAGDALWGIALLCHTLEVPMEEVMCVNISKLEKRYPDLCFNADHAVQQRDKNA